MRILSSRLCSLSVASGCIAASTGASAQGLETSLNWKTSETTINSFNAQAFGIAPGSGVIATALVGTGQAGVWNVVLVSSGQIPGTGQTVGQYVETTRIAIDESAADVDLGNGATLHRTEDYVAGLMTTTNGFTAVVNCTIFSVSLTGTPENSALSEFHAFVPVHAYDDFDPAEIDLDAAAQARNGDGPAQMPTPPNDEKASVCMERWYSAIRSARLINNSDRKTCLAASGGALAGCAISCAAFNVAWAPCFFTCSAGVLIVEAICMSAAKDKFDAAVEDARQKYRDCMRDAVD